MKHKNIARLAIHLQTIIRSSSDNKILILVCATVRGNTNDPWHEVLTSLLMFPHCLIQFTAAIQSASKKQFQTIVF